MRIVFLLAAEARGLLARRRAVGRGLRGHAAARPSSRRTLTRGGEELLERRFDAWPRLLATFRAVHGGVEHDRVRLPGYGGGLFDPDRYPVPRGRRRIEPLRISNRTILNVLDSLQTLEVEVPGGRERRPLSFRALGVEQIGHVYERLLDHTAIRADAPALGLVGKTGKEPEVALAGARGSERVEARRALLDFLEELTGQERRTLRSGCSASEPEPRAHRRGFTPPARRRGARRARHAVPRPRPRRRLRDADGVPRRAPSTSPQSPERRATGTHYTPPSLTEPIVRYALEPSSTAGRPKGRPRSGS